MAWQDDAQGLAPMDKTPPEIAARHSPGRISFVPTATILLAISFGLCSGFLDVGIIVFKKYCWNEERHYRNARDFPWTVPLSHAAVMLVPGVLLAAVNGFWPRAVSRARGRGYWLHLQPGRPCCGCLCMGHAAYSWRPGWVV